TSEQAVLALAHVIDEIEMCQARMAPFQVGHEARQDADDFAALRQRAVRDRPHRTRRAAAVDDAVAIAREQFTEAECRFAITRVGLVAGSAVNADAHGKRREAGTGIRDRESNEEPDRHSGAGRTSFAFACAGEIRKRIPGSALRAAPE